MEHAVHTGAELKRWRRRLGWTEGQAALWWGCTVQAWQKWERQPYLTLPVINRIQEFEWVRSQGYEPRRGQAGTSSRRKL